MTFLNGLLSLGGLAFTVPLAIHLLFRNRFQTVDWGAMHLLTGVMRSNHRRIQLLQMLLLALRCMIPILLAVCLARPVLTGFRALPGDTPTSVILAIDESRSMSAQDASGSSRFDRLRLGMQDVLNGLSRSDEVILVRSSQLTDPPIVTGRMDASDQLRSMDATSGRVDLVALVQRAIEATSDASNLRRRIIIASDFPSVDVRDQTVESMRRLSAQLDPEDDQTTISLLNVGGESSSLQNVFVDSLEVDSPAVVSGRTAELSARIRNDCDVARNDVRLTWSVDGIAIESSTVRIDSRSTLAVHIDHSFDDPGVHEVSVSIEIKDAIRDDNRRAIGVDVIDDVRVLVVDGQPSSEPLEGETDFLSAALSPFAYSKADRADAIRTVNVSGQTASQAISDQDPNIVVMANVARPDVDLKRRLGDFVLDGGSLVVFDGDLIQPDAYNEPWKGGGGSWRLPATLGRISGDPGSSKSIPMDVGNLRYKAWQELGDSDSSLFDSVRLFRHRRLSIDVANSGGEPGTTTLLNTAAGRPLFVAGTRGRGRIAQFAFPCDDDWSEFPLRAVFVPMMQQLMLEMAGSQRRTTYELSDTVSVLTTDFWKDRAQVDEDKIVVEFPDGTTERLEPDSSATPGSILVRPTKTGVYRFRCTSITGSASAKTMRVVDIASSESELQGTDPARFQAIADFLGASVFTDASDLRSDEQTRRYGREIWRWLLGLLLVALVGEVIVQQFLAGRFWNGARSSKSMTTRLSESFREAAS